MNRLGFVAAADPGEISGGRVALRAPPGSDEIRFPFLGVAHQDIECAGRATIGERLAVQPGGNIGDLRCAKPELRHSLGWDAVLHDGRDQLTVLIAEHHLVSDEVRAGFSAPGVRAMAEAAIAPEDLLATGNLLGRGGRTLRIIRRPTREGACAGDGGARSVAAHAMITTPRNRKRLGVCIR